MPPLLIAFTAALVGSLLLTPLARGLARRLGVVDRPDGLRKLHSRPMPMWGGIAVYLALVLGLIAARGLLPEVASLGELSTAVVLACGFVCLLGCIDDSWDLNGRFKLLLQIVSVLPVVASGYYFDRVVAFGIPIQFGWLGVPLTVLWLVGCINALNLLDGMDGLSSVVGLSAAVIMAIIATTDGHAEVAAVAIVLAGSLAGFLAYNLPPASIYLGDSGSMVIGLVAGIISLQGGLKTTATLSLTVPAVVMSVPMLDTALAIVRRKLTGKRFDAADRGHIHHRLLDRGLSTWQALCVIGSLCLATGAAATAASILRVEALAWVTALGVFMLLVRTRAFGHYEYALVSRFLAIRVADAVGLMAALFGARWQRRLEALAGLPFAEAWTALTEEMAFCRAHRLELSLSRHHEHTAAHTWASTQASPVARSEVSDAWSLSLRFAGPQGELCELRMIGDPTAAVGFNRLARAARILSIFGSHWARHPDQVTPESSVAADSIVLDATPAVRIAA
jgi:UDP-GlcNAc:undecaprenyl-phosphate/decaprenyl-phosphate GlcNAc-1-phosphate transferase